MALDHPAVKIPRDQFSFLHDGPLVLILQFSPFLGSSFQAAPVVPADSIPLVVLGLAPLVLAAVLEASVVQRLICLKHYDPSFIMGYYYFGE
jgi:tellurite resistance protein TehA-like permease